MSDIQNYRNPSQIQEVGAQRGYELQFQNPRIYNKQQDWMKDEVPGENKNQSIAQNLDHLQKEFLKNEYFKQQDDLRKKKDDELRLKQNEMQNQYDLKKQLEEDNFIEKQLAVDKKRALGDLYRVQIEQASKDKQKKKQEEIWNDKNRLQQAMEGITKDGTKALQYKEEMRRDLYNSQNNQNQPKQRVQDYQSTQEQGSSLMNQIGNGDDKKRAYIEKFENLQAANGRNFVSYEREKQKKSEAFTNQINMQLPPYQNKNQIQYGSNVITLNNKDKREYNETLKKQMIENQMKKEYEKQERSRNVEAPPSQQQYQQPIQNQPQRLQQLRQEQFDIMGNPKNQFNDAQSRSSNKREDQQRYRSILDSQTQQQKILKSESDRPPLGSYNGSGPIPGDDFDIMGNRKNIYSQQNLMNKNVISRKDDQQRYRDFLNLQQEQNKVAKYKEEEEVQQLERRLAENMAINNQGNEGQGNARVGYNPVTNSITSIPQGQRGYEENRGGSSQSGKGNQQRIDYSEFANKNILSNNY